MLRRGESAKTMLFAVAPIICVLRHSNLLLLFVNLLVEYVNPTAIALDRRLHAPQAGEQELSVPPHLGHAKPIDFAFRDLSYVLIRLFRHLQCVKPNAEAVNQTHTAQEALLFAPRDIWPIPLSAVLLQDHALLIQLAQERALHVLERIFPTERFATFLQSQSQRANLLRALAMEF